MPKEETDKKLSMSLDALIKKRRSTAAKRNEMQDNKNGFVARGGQTGNAPAAKDGYGDRAPGRVAGPRPPPNGQPVNGNMQASQQAFTGTGFMMPNFGMPFGSFGPTGNNARGQNNNMGRGFPMMNSMPFPPGMMPGAQLGGGLNPDAQPFVPAEPPQPVAVPQARLEQVSGEVRVSFRKQDIVRISKDGNMTVDTKGVRGVVDVSITRAKNAKPEDEWSVSDGRSLTRFRDGMTIPGRSFLAKQRGSRILEAFGEVDPSAAAAATAASNAAARAAGIFPAKGGRPADAGPGRNAGLHPPGHAQRHPDGPVPKGSQHWEGDEANNEADVSQEEKDRIRRLRAKGRYRPY